jgi:hypothetical protein
LATLVRHLRQGLATAGSTDEHTSIAPDLFTAETPLGSYQEMTDQIATTDQIVMSRTPGAFLTVPAPRGSYKAEWLECREGAGSA